MDVLLMHVQYNKTVDGMAYNMNFQCMKTKAYVAIHPDDSIDVTCKNASHSAWKAGGNYFDCVDTALNHYRSASMKAIIRYAVKLVKEHRESNRELTDPKPVLTYKAINDMLKKYEKEHEFYTGKLISALKDSTVEAYGSTTDYLNLVKGRIHMLEMIKKEFRLNSK